jgi:hypothetical protein
MKNSLVLLVLGALAAPALPQSVMIDVNELPLELDTYGRYGQNQSVFRWTPFDSTRTHWNLTGYPRTLTAKMGLRDYDQGRVPAPESMEVDDPVPDVVEMDTLGSGTEQYVYLWKDSFGLHADGIDFETGGFRFIGNYRPDGDVYNLPVYYGGSWNTAWTWQYEIIPGIPYVANEQHEKRICARGKIRVPMSGEYYWPSLVVKDHMTFSDNMGTNDTRWIYEWVVPGIFCGGNGVAAAMSQNGAAPNFMNVEQMFQMQSCLIPGWDASPPQFANTRAWPDTLFSGPFVVWSDITDDDAVGDESLFYRVNQGGWVAVESDSDAGDRYFFTIPPVTPPARIDYFVWARDQFCADSEVELWTTWPVCSPESTMITFNATGAGSAEPRPLLPGEANLQVTSNPFASSVRFTLSHPSAAGATVRIYDATGQSVRHLLLSWAARAGHTATWDGRAESGVLLPSGAYFYLASAPGWQATGRLLLAR